jgi:hypothetical protein
MATWTLAKKEFVLLARDPLALALLLVMPFLFILILGMLLGEGFGQKPDDRLRILIVDQDRGPGLREGHTWSDEVKADLIQSGINVQLVPSVEEAEAMIRTHKRAAILVLEPEFGAKVTQCSFLKYTGNRVPDEAGAVVGSLGWAAGLNEGINPFHHDGVYLDRISARLLKDDGQPVQAAIIEQVSQVSLLRVLLPYMIGKAFERLSKEGFIELLGREVRLPVPKGTLPGQQFIILQMFKAKGINLEFPEEAGAVIGNLGVKMGQTVSPTASLNDALRVAAPNDEAVRQYRGRVGVGVQAALKQQFENYDLTGKTWADLTKSRTGHEGEGGDVSEFQDQGGMGLINRGAARYQLLVPSYTVLFSFLLVMIVGWLFVTERRQGTLKRLQAAPITRRAILLGKFLPCLALSLAQGVILLVCGRLVFGMRWGPENWSPGQQVLALLPVVVTTSLAATGLAMLVAAVARTEVQVALYGAVPALVLAMVGGCVFPREMMPDSMQFVSLLTPHGWALDAYRELLNPNPTHQPSLAAVAGGCAALAGFGLGFLALAWTFLRLD